MALMVIIIGTGKHINILKTTNDLKIKMFTLNVSIINLDSFYRLDITINYIFKMFTIISNIND